jgi:hypothetical protein
LEIKEIEHMFTRRHMVAIAEVLRGRTPLDLPGTEAQRVCHQGTVEAIADMLAEHNDNFKRDVFLKAAGQGDVA